VVLKVKKGLRFLKWELLYRKQEWRGLEEKQGKTKLDRKVGEGKKDRNEAFLNGLRRERYNNKEGEGGKKNHL